MSENNDNPFEWALRALWSGVNPERAALLADLAGSGDMRILAAHGIDADLPWMVAPISLSVIKQVLRDGQPVVCADMRDDPTRADTSSSLLLEVRSVACVPLRTSHGKVVGVLYADTRVTTGAFGKREVAYMMGLARQLEQVLPARTEPAPEPPQVSTPPVINRAPAPPSPRQPERPDGAKPQINRPAPSPTGERPGLFGRLNRSAPPPPLPPPPSIAPIPDDPPPSPWRSDLSR